MSFYNDSADLPKKAVNFTIKSDYRNTVVSSYTVTAAKSGEDDVIENLTGTTANLTLAYGEWNISVVGKNSGGVVVCEGNKTITVDSGTSDVIIGVAYKTGGVKCNYSYGIADIVSKIKITATRSGYTTLTNQVAVDTASLSGSIYLFDILGGSWNCLVEAMNASNAVYFSKSFTATVAESGLFTNSSVLDQKIATDPVFSLAGGSFTSDQTISLSTTTADAEIRYTTDGSTPSGSTFLYSVPIVVSGTGSHTIKAITIKSGLTSSSVVSNTYSINYPDCSTPTFSPNSGTFTSATNITITSTAGSTIHYTTNGTTPTTGSPSIISGSTISLSSNGTYTVKAIAVKTGYDNSSVGSSGSIVINISLPDCATPTFSPNSGTFTSATNVTITSTAGSTIHYTTNGTTPTTGSPSITSGSTISLSSNGTYTVKAIAVKTGYNNSSVGSSGSIVINLTLPDCEAPVISTTTTELSGNSVDTQPDSITIQITSGTSGASIYYTDNGDTPTTSSTLYGGTFAISATKTIKAIAVKSGYNDSGVASKEYKKTVVQTTYDTGAGNYLLVKGSGGPLGDWANQFIMKWTTGNVWYWVTWEEFSLSTFTFKCFTNYGTWMPNPDRTGTVGETNYSAW